VPIAAAARMKCRRVAMGSPPRSRTRSAGTRTREGAAPGRAPGRVPSIPRASTRRTLPATPMPQTSGAVGRGSGGGGLSLGSGRRRRCWKRVPGDDRGVNPRPSCRRHPLPRTAAQVARGEAPAPGPPPRAYSPSRCQMIVDSPAWFSV
jgi:hypothetical protein